MATDYPKPDSLLVGPRGVGQPYDMIFEVSASITPASVNNVVTAEQTFNPAGFAAVRLATDRVFLWNAPARTNSTLIGSVRVSADGTIAINYVNPTAGALTPPAGTYSFLVFRMSSNPAK